MIEVKAKFSTKAIEEIKELGIDSSEYEIDLVSINPKHITSFNPSEEEGCTSVWMFNGRSHLILETYDNFKRLVKSAE